MERALDLFKRINDLVFLLLVSGITAALQTVPVDVVHGSFLIDVFAVVDIETAVVVFWVIRSMKP